MYTYSTIKNKELIKDMYLALEYLNYDINELDIMIKTIKREIKIKKLLQI
jgi:hypothetical protein